MDDRGLMCSLETVGNLLGDGNRVRRWERASRDPVSQRLPLYELEHERRNTVRFLHAVNRGDEDD